MHLTHNPRVALVTGAGRGIGKAIAERLAAHGHTVLCVSKSETCVAVANDIIAKGQKAKAFQVDVSDAAAVAKACEQINAEFGAVEILVNNAGITRDKLVMAMSDQDWNDVISTNLSSAFYWVKGLVRPMTKKRWGRIISISSVTGVQGNAGQAAFSRRIRVPHFPTNPWLRLGHLADGRAAGRRSESRGRQCTYAKRFVSPAGRASRGNRLWHPYT